MHLRRANCTRSCNHYYDKITSTVENYQKFMWHVEEEGRREKGMQINILMQNTFFLPQDPTRQKKGYASGGVYFFWEKKKNPNSMGRNHFSHF